VYEREKREKREREREREGKKEMCTAEDTGIGAVINLLRSLHDAWRQKI